MPVPSNTEQSQGIFTSYMQFMDTVAASWSTVKGQQRGIDSLKAIHNLVLAQNKQHIIDPVSIINRGTSFEQGSREEKRKNYAFYVGYARMNVDLEGPSYGTKSTGSGVMFRVSQNVYLVGGKINQIFPKKTTIWHDIGRKYRKCFFCTEDYGRCIVVQDDWGLPHGYRGGKRPTSVKTVLPETCRVVKGTCPITPFGWAKRLGRWYFHGQRVVRTFPPFCWIWQEEI